MKIKTLLATSGILALAATTNAATLGYTTGLDVWLDASDIDGTNNSSLLDNDPVFNWANKGTTGVNDAVTVLTGAGGDSDGTYLAGGGNGGQDAIGLDNTRFQFGQEFMDSTSVTMYFVVNQNGSATAQGTLFTDYGDVSNKLLNLRTADGSAGAYRRDGAGATNTVAHTGALATSGWATIFYSYDAATDTATWGELGSTNSATNAAFDETTTFEGTHGGPVTLFSFHDGNNGFDFNGMTSEVLIYDHLLDAGQRSQVESYLAAKVVPEPSSAALLGLGGLALILRRRK